MSLFSICLIFRLKPEATDLTFRFDLPANRLCLGGGWSGGTSRTPTQQRPQPKSSLVHLRLRRSFGDTQHVRDLAMLQPFHVVQDERRAASLGELRQGALEIDAINRTIPQPVSKAIRDYGRVIESVGQLTGPRRPATDVIQNLVRRKPVEPRSKRRFPSEAIQFAVGRQEDLLQQVLGVRRIAEHPHRQTENAPRVGPVQLLERPQVPLTTPLDEREIAGTLP
jgi:hypothetical protein